MRLLLIGIILFKQDLDIITIENRRSYTMNYIWDFEKLTELCNHKNIDIKNWALKKLILLYPEKSGDIAIELAYDKNIFIAKEAIEYFLNYPNHIYSDKLLELYKQSSGQIAGKITKIFVKQNDLRIIDAFQEKYPSHTKDLLGYSLSVYHLSYIHIDKIKKIIEKSLEIIPELKDGNLDVADTLFSAALNNGIGIEALLDLCFNKFSKYEIILSLLIKIDNYCGSWYSIDDLEEDDDSDDDGNYMIQESLDNICMNDFSDVEETLQNLYTNNKYDEIIEVIFTQTFNLLDLKKRQFNDDSFDLWIKGKSKLCQNIEAISAFNNLHKKFSEDYKKYIANVCISIFSSFVECKDIIGLNLNTIDLDTALNVFFQERRDVEEDDKIIENFIKQIKDNEKIIDTCFSHIENNPESPANLRIIRLLGSLNNKSIASKLFNLEIESNELDDEIINTLKGIGIDAIDIIKTAFDKTDENKIIKALFILKDIPAFQTVDIIVNYWDKLLEINKQCLLEAVREIGDKKFIEFVKKEIKGEDFDELITFNFLCLLNNVDNPQFEKFEHLIKEQEKKVKDAMSMLESGNTARLLEEPLNIELKCRNCKKSYHYKIEKAFIEKNSSDYFIQDKILCKNCNSLDHYEITNNGKLSIMAYSMLIMNTNEKILKNIDEIRLSTLDMRTLNGTIKPLNEALANYEEKLKKEPGNPEYLIGYANTLSTAKRAEDAIEYYKKAVISDPLAIEAYETLGGIAETKGDDISAYNYYKKALNIVNNFNLYKSKEENRKKYKETIFNAICYFEEKLGITSTIKNFPVEKKLDISRNDPCFCGSGKKYKKCCLGKAF